MPRDSILPTRPHLGTTDINVFSGICFSTYFTILFILTPTYLHRNPVYKIPVVPEIVLSRLSYKYNHPLPPSGGLSLHWHRS